MTDALRRAGLAPLVLLLSSLLAGCSGDSGPLAEDDLPGGVEETTTSTAGAPSATMCEDLREVQQDISVSGASDGKDYRFWTYRLDDGTWIAVSVGELGYPYTDQGQALDDLAEAVESCSGQSDHGEVAALGDVPEGSVGYRSTMTDSNGTTEGETLVAEAGDRIVLVVATHDEGATPSVDVRDLLAQAMDAAPDLDLS